MSPSRHHTDLYHTAVLTAALRRFLGRHRYLTRRGADLRNRYDRQLPQTVLLALHQRILAQVAYLSRRLAEKLPLLPCRHVQRLHHRGQKDEGHTLRQDRCRRSYRQGASDQRRLADRIPRGRRMARRGLEIRRLRRMERNDHHDKHTASACL